METWISTLVLNNVCRLDLSFFPSSYVMNRLIEDDKEPDSIVNMLTNPATTQYMP